MEEYKEVYIKFKFIKEAYELGARYNPETNKWRVPDIKEINKYITNKEPIIIKDDYKRISEPIKPFIHDNRWFIRQVYYYYRSNCKCDLCNTPITEKNKYIIKENNLYRTLCYGCVNMTYHTLHFEINKECMYKFMEYFKVSEEEFYKLVVKHENL